MSIIFYSIGLCLFGIDAVFTCCSDGWTRFGDSCYFFGHDDHSFQDAQHFCEHFNANLVNIETSAENAFLRSFLSGLNDPKHWIGLTDELIEGVWKLYPSETTASFTDWGGNGNEPNGAKDVNCGAVWATFDYHWLDEPCTNSFKPICEKAAETEVTQIVG